MNLRVVLAITYLWLSATAFAWKAHNYERNTTVASEARDELGYPALEHDSPSSPRVLQQSRPPKVLIYVVVALKDVDKKGRETSKNANKILNVRLCRKGGRTGKCSLVEKKKTKAVVQRCRRCQGNEHSSIYQRAKFRVWPGEYFVEIERPPNHSFAGDKTASSSTRVSVDSMGVSELFKAKQGAKSKRMLIRAVARTYAARFSVSVWEDNDVDGKKDQNEDAFDDAKIELEGSSDCRRHRRCERVTPFGSRMGKAEIVIPERERREYNLKVTPRDLYSRWVFDPKPRAGSVDFEGKYKIRFKNGKKSYDVKAGLVPSASVVPPPTPSPTQAPTKSPTKAPTAAPTGSPAAFPTESLTHSPAPTRTASPTPTPPGNVTGTVFEDLNGNGILDKGEPGIPGTDVVITDTEGNTQTLTTNEMGMYMTEVPPGEAVINIDETTLPPGLVQTAGTDPTTVDVPSGSTSTDVDGYYKPTDAPTKSPTASPPPPPDTAVPSSSPTPYPTSSDTFTITGTITLADSTGTKPSMDNFTVILHRYDGSGQKTTTTTTNETGQYEFEGYMCLEYYIQVEIPEGYTIADSKEDVDSDGFSDSFYCIADSTTIINAVVHKQIKFQGRIWFDNGNSFENEGESGVDEAHVFLLRKPPRGYVVEEGYAMTKSDGTYEIIIDEIKEGKYYVSTRLRPLYRFTKKRRDSHVNDMGESDFIAIENNKDAYVVNAGLVRLRRRTLVNGFVLVSDGTNEAQPMHNLTVTLRPRNYSWEEVTKTEASGSYEFSKSLFLGTEYLIEIDAPEGHTFDGSQDDDVDSDGRSGFFVVTESQNSFTFDAFAKKKIATIGGYFWFDEIADGQKQDYEPTLDDAYANLYRQEPDGRQLQLERLVLMNFDGEYEIDVFDVGTYTVELVHEEVGSSFTQKGGDSDVNATGYSDPITVEKREEPYRVSAGIIRAKEKAVISGTVWVLDSQGSVSDRMGVPFPVTLWSNKRLERTTTLDVNGNFEFVEELFILTDYYVQIDVSEGYSIAGNPEDDFDDYGSSDLFAVAPLDATITLKANVRKVSDEPLTDATYFNSPSPSFNVDAESQ